MKTLCKRALRQSQPKQPQVGGNKDKDATHRSKTTTQAKYYLETPAVTATTTATNVSILAFEKGFIFCLILD